MVDYLLGESVAFGSGAVVAFESLDEDIGDAQGVYRFLGARLLPELAFEPGLEVFPGRKAFAETLDLFAIYRGGDAIAEGLASLIPLLDFREV